MKINEHTALQTPKVLLVPYSTHHVPTYHAWMQDPSLQAATASEPLTLEEEYAMQRSWRVDEDKLTFIACVAPTDSKRVSAEKGVVEAGVYDDATHMIGDVNLFVSEAEDDDDGEAGGQDGKEDVGLIGEVEIMVARQDVQGKGYGRAILLVFMWYVVIHLQESQTEKWRARLRMLRVKIDKDNKRSIGLFKNVGFVSITESPNYFGELELRWRIGADEMERLREKIRDLYPEQEVPRVLEYAEVNK